MLLRAREKHTVQAMQSYMPLMSSQKRELDRQNLMQMGLNNVEKCGFGLNVWPFALFMWTEDGLPVVQL